MQLDPRCASSDRALRLLQRAVARIDATERDEPAARGLRQRERAVVGGPIRVRFGEREHDRASVHDFDRADELVDIEAGAVGVGAPKVRVTVEDA